MKRQVCAALVLLLAACTGVDRNAGPAFSVTSLKGIEAAASCVAAGMDAKMIDRTGIGKTITHRIETRQPGKLLEVHPQQMIADVEVYYFSITAAPGGSTIGVHGLRGAVPDMSIVAQSCI